MRLDEYVARRAAIEPNTSAVIINNLVLTYGALDSHVNKLVHYFQQNLQIGRGIAVAVHMPRSVEQVIAFLAIMRAQAIYVPIDPAVPSRLITEIIGACNVGCVLTQGSLTDCLLFSVPIIDIELTSGSLEAHPYSEEIITCTASLRARIPLPSDTAFIIHTSGSTGKPKGVPVKYSGLEYWSHAIPHLFPHLSSNSRILGFSNIGGDPHIWEYMTAWICGGSLYLVDDDTRLNANKLSDYIISYQITDAILIPSVVNSLDLEKTIPLWSKSGLKVLYGVGEASSKRLLELCEKHSITFINLYGPTEATFGFSAKVCHSKEVDSKGRLPIGQPYGNQVKGYILSDEGNVVSEGVEGNFYIESPYLSEQYVNNAEETKKNFITRTVLGKERRLFRTGDRMIFENGNYYYVKRMDNSNVKIRGQQVDLIEVEQKLEQCPGVKQAIVLLREIKGISRLVAFVTVQEGCEPRKILQHINGQLLSISYPTVFVKLDHLPLNINRKKDRRALQTAKIDEANVMAYSRSSISPRTALETRLAHIWEEVFEVKNVGIEIPFPFLGGDSINLKSILGKINVVFGIEILPTQCAPLDELTIEKLASIVFEARFIKYIKDGAANRLLIQAKPNTANMDPLFLLPPITGNGTTNYAKFVSALVTPRSVYVIDLPGIYNDLDVCTDLEILAKCLVFLIKSVNPHCRSMCLAGWSFGAKLAVEVQKQLESQQIKLSFLALIDGMSPNVLKQMKPHEFCDHLMSLMQSLVGMYNTPRQTLLKTPSNIRDILKPLSKEQQIITAFSALETKDPEIRRVIEVTKANLIAALFYSPPSITQPLQRNPHIYASQETLQKGCFLSYNADLRSALGWHETYLSSSRPHDPIRGSHLALMSDPTTWVHQFNNDLDMNSNQLLSNISRFQSSESRLNRRFEDSTAMLRQMLSSRDQLLGEQTQTLTEQKQQMAEMQKSMTEMQKALTETKDSVAQLVEMMRLQTKNHEVAIEQLRRSLVGTPSSSLSSGDASEPIRSPSLSPLKISGADSPPDSSRRRHSHKERRKDKKEKSEERKEKKDKSEDKKRKSPPVPLGSSRSTHSFFTAYPVVSSATTLHAVTSPALVVSTSEPKDSSAFLKDTSKATSGVERGAATPSPNGSS